MALTIGVPRETFPGERRVAITPRATESLGKLGADSSSWLGAAEVGQVAFVPPPEPTGSTLFCGNQKS